MMDVCLMCNHVKRLELRAVELMPSCTSWSAELDHVWSVTMITVTLATPCSPPTLTPLSWWRRAQGSSVPRAGW